MDVEAEYRRRRGLLEASKRSVRYRDDPGAYAREILGIEWWCKQIDIANSIHHNRRTVVYAGHSVGKCVTVGEIIELADGTPVPAEDLVGRQFSVWSINDRFETRPSQAFAADNGVQPVAHLYTESGRRICRTLNHPLLTAPSRFGSGKRTSIGEPTWQPISNLRPGDVVLVPAISPVRGDRRMPEHHVRILAYLIGNGSLEKTAVNISQPAGVGLDEFRRDIEAEGCTLAKIHGRDSVDWRVARREGSKRNPVYDLVREHGLWHSGARDKHIPAAIWQLPLNQLAEFLSRLYATDGWAYAISDGDRAEIGYCSVSLALCEAIQRLLLRFGVTATIREKKTSWSHNGERRNGNAYSCDILNRSGIERFANQIGIFGKERAVSRAVEIVQSRNSKVRDWRTRLAPAGFRWERIKKIVSAGEQSTVAITVPGDHTYLTHFVEHNTHSMGGIVQWHFDCWDPSITLTTAPSWSSIHDLLWGELKSQRPHGAAGRLLDLRLDGGPMHYAAGHNAESGSGFQGRHEARVLVVLDEAMGVPPYIWEATNAMMTSPDCRVIALGNPTETSGEYYDIRENPDWSVVTISCLDHPNIAAELAGKPAPFPKAVSLMWVQEMIRTHCMRTSSPTADAFEFPPRSGQWWDPDDVFRSRVLGLFPRQSAQGIWSEAWLIKARDGGLTWKADAQPEIGADIARYGDDHTTLYGRRGPVVTDRESYAKQDTMETVGRIVRLADKMAADCACDGLRIDPKRIEIKVDDTGLGGGVTDRLKELSYRVAGIDFGGKAVDPEEFFNRGSEMWFGAAYRARDMRLDLSRLPDDVYRRLSAELRARRYKIQSDKTLRAESKDDIKKRIGRSPDDADALVLAFAGARITMHHLAWEGDSMKPGHDREQYKRDLEKSPDGQQLREVMPEVGERPCAGAVCGNCIWREDAKDGKSWCGARLFTVKDSAPACDNYDRMLGQ